MPYDNGKMMPYPAGAKKGMKHKEEGHKDYSKHKGMKHGMADGGVVCRRIFSK